MNDGAIALAILFIPLVGIFMLFAYLHISTREDQREFYIESLREKVKSLPLDEKALKKRLETFDKILAEVENEEVKMEFLEQLAGEKVAVKKTKKPFGVWDTFDEERKKREDFYDYLQGIGYRSPSRYLRVR